MQSRARSEMQIQVLRLYRDAWKYANSKPQPLKADLFHYIRAEIEKHRDIPRIKFHKVEYHLRAGRNRLNLMKNTSMDGISFK